MRVHLATDHRLHLEVCGQSPRTQCMVIIYVLPLDSVDAVDGISSIQPFTQQNQHQQPMWSDRRSFEKSMHSE